MKTARYDLIVCSLLACICSTAAVFSAVAVANAQELSRQLSPGTSGADVSALQTFLAADTAIYPEGLITGYYGSLTTAAVERYQCKNGIVCTGTPSTTGYGRVGPATLAKIRMQLGGTSIPPVTGGPDMNAPILSALSVATTSTTAVIRWTTNEPARSAVLYSQTPPVLSPESFAALARASDPTLDTSSEVTLSGLASSTLYYYVLESTDASSNIQYDINHSFRTNP